VKENIKLREGLGHLKILFFLIYFAGSPFICSYSQENQAAPTRQSSLDAYSKGDYELAYSSFNQLLLKYPKDPLYKYYSGVCLVRLKRDSEKAAALLQQAVSSASVVRTLPPDALFYLGRAQQMAGKFSEARESYTLYSDQVGKKKAREDGVPEFIQECNQNKGLLAEKEVTAAGGNSAGRNQKAQPADEPAAKEAVALPAGKADSSGKELPAGYEKILDEALGLQYKADSINLIIGDQKSELDKLPEEKRSSLRLMISKNELLAASFQKSADQKYNEAQSQMTPDNRNTARKPDTALTYRKPAAVQQEKREEKTIVISREESDSLKNIIPVVINPAEAYSVFEVLPGQAAYPGNKIPIDPAVPPGLIYRIQLAVFRNPVAVSFFKGITPVFGFKVPGSDKTNYYAGMFRRSEDAKKALLEVKKAGFRDAYIVAFAESKSVSSDRAAVMEKEWGTRPFTGLKSLPGIPLDTIPPALSFRVEVERSPKPLKQDVVEAFKTLAGSRGLDIEYLADGNIAYLIGKFITFESAAEYADLLVRNNYRKARVVAWLGNREVPVETARQLFNNVK
jgi:Tetratricopeptide repeat